ncbi:MAG: DUF4150 domain-containing protein [Desulfovibrionaceae bacterium]
MFALCTKNAQIVSQLDVCKTPSPSGVTPVTYPNIGMTAQGNPPASKVRIAGMPALNKKSQCAPSSGDEAGTAGGVVSSVIKGPVAFAAGSLKVKIQGSPAVRQNDATTHNQKNAAGQAAAPCQTKVKINS